MRAMTLALVLATGSLFTTARASIIAYNNFGAGNSFDTINSYSVTNRSGDYQSIATPFNSGVTGNVERYTVAVTGNKAFTLKLYQDGLDGTPGTVLETLTTPIPTSTSTPALMEIMSAVNPHLVSGSRYWVALFPASNSDGSWMNTSQFVFGMGDQRSANGTWNVFLESKSSVLRVEVPEPAAIGVFAVSILGILNHRWRKA